MISLDNLYNLRDTIPKSIRRILPGFIRKRINRKFFKYYFLLSTLDKLPHSSYPEEGNIEYQRSLIQKFKTENKQTSTMTCPHLNELILMKYQKTDEISFLDVGGEKIDFYLELKKNYKNIKYYLFNQEPMLRPFKILKSENEYDDLIIIENEKDLSKNKYNFVNFGSCIQYFDNYEEFINIILEKSEYVFFSGTHLYSSSDKKLYKDLIVKQVNVLPQVNYLYFFNSKYFFEIFKKKNFELVFLSKNLTDKINYDNFHNLLDKIQYSDFLLKKNNKN